jgi:hypothetical protein
VIKVVPRIDVSLSISKKPSTSAASFHAKIRRGMAEQTARSQLISMTRAPGAPPPRSELLRL